jgi:hypothetical protein
MLIENDLQNSGVGRDGEERSGELGEGGSVCGGVRVR